MKTGIKNKNLESKIISIFDKVIVAPYNAGLIILTFIIWLLSVLIYAAAHNFDILISIQNYIKFLSFGAIVVGVMNSDAKDIMKLGILTYLVSMLTVIFAKVIISDISLILGQGVSFFAHTILRPLSIFYFLLLMKNIWLFKRG